MIVSGIGNTSLNSYLVGLLNTRDDASSETLPSLACVSGQSPYQRESLHVELSLTDGTSLSIDYEYVGTEKKTSYELSRFADYTYGNDLFSPEKTAGRILDFAGSLWDGSEEKLTLLSDAIDKGIDQARSTFGSMPSWLDTLISRTSDLLHKGLDNMKAGMQAAA